MSFLSCEIEPNFRTLLPSCHVCCSLKKKLKKFAHAQRHRGPIAEPLKNLADDSKQSVHSILIPTSHVIASGQAHSVVLSPSSNDTTLSVAPLKEALNCMLSGFNWRLIEGWLKVLPPLTGGSSFHQGSSASALSVPVCVPPWGWLLQGRIDSLIMSYWSP